MQEKNSSPRIVLISQWPNILNAEYELIAKIRHTGFKIAVVDYLGFDVETGKCINDAKLSEEYDFAVSFHYDTPKFLNIPTYLWVANPLEFMHLRGDYRSVLIHHLRAYDDYLYNGSGFLKSHIKQVVGGEWQDTGMEFFSSCSRNVIFEPRLKAQSNNAAAARIFYCGVNWERVTDKTGRSQGLFDLLQQKDIADFYGPKLIEGCEPWGGFASYRGEIPFDGISTSRTMQEYAAVLAISSPAHIKSCTSSSRVFEGFSSGVPVISDDNPHVRQLFGDLVYYFSGTTDQEHAESIAKVLEHIRSNPDEATERVRQAQAKISEVYSFEKSLTQVLAATSKVPDSASARKEKSRSATIDIFLFHHDPYAEFKATARTFPNVAHLLKAASVVAAHDNAHVRVFNYDPDKTLSSELVSAAPDVEWVALNEQQLKVGDWAKLRLGEKVARLAEFSTGDFAVFLTQSDYVQHDYFTKPLRWFRAQANAQQAALYVGGFFVNDLSAKASVSTAGILRNNASVGLYRWTQDSIAEHQLGQFCLSRQVMKTLDFARISRFDVLLPVALISEGLAKNIPLYRARHLLLRVESGYFHRHYNDYCRSVAKGFWAQHYELLSNYNHELNALYDAFNESPEIVGIAEHVTGRNLLRTAPVDPAVYVVNQFIGRLRPMYQLVKKARVILRLRKE